MRGRHLLPFYNSGDGHEDLRAHLHVLGRLVAGGEHRVLRNRLHAEPDLLGERDADEEAPRNRRKGGRQLRTAMRRPVAAVRLGRLLRRQQKPPCGLRGVQ